MVRRIIWAVALVAISVPIVGQQSRGQALAQSSFSVTSFGLKYATPSEYFTNCTNYSWLHGSNYTQGCGGSTTPQQQLGNDLTFLQAQHVGSFLRVWVSLDQLFDRSKWSSTTGFGGWDPSAFANLDDALHQFASHGMKIELGLLVWETSCDSYFTNTPRQNCFHPEALDGLHPQMRQNYLTAISQFVSHIASDPQDSAAIGAIDTQSEGYYQDEVYVNVMRNYPNDTNLGRWNYSMPPWPNATQCYVLGNTLCSGGSSGHGCLANATDSKGYLIDTACVDTNIIEPWLHDLYSTIKAAGPTLTVTVGDTGRLLTTDTGQYSGQAHWIGLYSPVSDVYDVHLYEDAPWNDSAKWATWVNLDKPYFVGEAGCATNHSSCTYNTGPISAPLQWWLDNMVQHYGAQSTLVEDHTSVWIYTYVNGQGSVRNLTSSGRYLQQVSGQAPTPTPIPSDTPTPTNIPVATTIPTLVSTLISTDTPQPMNTSVPTNTPVPSDTPTNTLVPTNTSVPTSTPTTTPTPLKTPLPTATPPASTATLFMNGFDSQGLGGVVTGTGTNQFSSAVANGSMTVEAYNYATAPHALAISLTSSSCYLTKQYPSGTLTHTLQFQLQVSSDVSISSTSSVDLASVAPTGTYAGKVAVVLTGSRSLMLSYVDSASQRHVMKTNASLTGTGWHSIRLQENVGTGSMLLALDGRQILNVTGADLGRQPIQTFSVGGMYAGSGLSSGGGGASGHFYLDDVRTSHT